MATLNKSTWVCLALLALLACSCSAPNRVGPDRAARTLRSWNALTSASSPPPRVFVKGDSVRFYFQSPEGVKRFYADWQRERVPARDYEVNSARLRASARTGSAREPGAGWREATVIAGGQWQKFATNLILSLTPAAPGSAAYYQALMADRVFYRDLDGAPHIADLESLPPGMEIERHFSPEATLELVAARAGSFLAETHPGSSLFLIMGPSGDWFPQPLLLDQARRECVSLSLAGLVGAGESNPWSTAAAGSKALLFEGHVIALVKNPISSMARLVDLCFQTTLKSLHLPMPRRKLAPPLAETRPPGMDLQEWERWLNHYTGTRPEDGALDLLIDGDRFYSRLLQAVDSATNHISLKFYIFDRDDVAVAVADRLRARSADIPVKVIVDRMGSLGAGAAPPTLAGQTPFTPPDSIISYLRQDSEVGVRQFLNPWFSFDHSKLCLVDGWRAWIGGMNIGREYRYEWHDVMVELTGPVVWSFEKEFYRNWAHAGPWGDLAYLAAALSQPSVPRFPSGDGGRWIKVRRLPTKTAWKPFATAVLGSLRQAQSYIYIENPYLFDKHVIRELVQARRRGVDVRVVMPRVNDLKPGYSSNLVTANYLRQHGIRVFFYPGMSHVKALLVDDWVCLGSGNLNHLSLRICREDNIATSDPAFVARVKRELFEEDFQRSYELSERLSVDWTDFLADLMLKTF